ncbi:hypothetical protein GQ53DRAFT_641382 [Thozetella sp. PMI_491]|nr:hypothetical protein GQ53DRAFT_641382 [Thozetella sp. PMI_491]
MTPGFRQWSPPASTSSSGSTGSRPPASASASTSATGSELLPHTAKYFEQAFGLNKASFDYDYATLKEACDHAPWREDQTYMRCTGMSAGLMSIVSQVKTCLKMAVESGSNFVLPAMPLRDSNDLKQFNFLNGDAYKPYDQWFDQAHLRDVLGRACPKMKVVHPDELDKTVAVKERVEILCSAAPGYQQFHPYFWVGKPYSTYFEGKLKELKDKAAENPPAEVKSGITVITVDSQFLLFRITDDPTGRDRRLWNDLSHAIRFRQQERIVVDRLVSKINRPYYAVHFRVENDTIWSSLEHQLGVDLDVLDKAWDKWGTPGAAKPLIYLACGDPVQVEKFVEAGAARGWEVTHKWRLLQDDKETTEMMNSLAFDFQGAIDLALMVRGQFFLGITGSAFSSSIGNLRDPTGRYRGSSFLTIDDEGAHTHLSNDGDADAYPCCL